MDSKPTNPKDLIGMKKCPLGLVPDTMSLFASLSFLEGALKYGRFNWREMGVSFTVYDDALLRHRAKLRAGEWADKDTKVPHISSMLACLAIIADSHVCGNLVDDRPPAQPTLAVEIDRLGDAIKYLQELFKDHNPKQFTIADGPQVETPKQAIWVP